MNMDEELIKPAMDYMKKRANYSGSYFFKMGVLFMQWRTFDEMPEIGEPLLLRFIDGSVREQIWDENSAKKINILQNWRYS